MKVNKNIVAVEEIKMRAEIKNAQDFDEVLLLNR